MNATRRLTDCPAVIFTAYTVPPDAEARGYSDWLRRVDNPFFNAIPGVGHYANWRVSDVIAGAPPEWDYFDFQGLASEADLERVWFSPDLDGFRREWLRLWGYGAGPRTPLLAHSYLMRPIRRSGTAPGRQARIAAGRGAPPDTGDLVLRLDSVLAKHFASEPGTATGDWCRPAAAGNPLGLDWISVTWEGVSGQAGAPAPVPAAATMTLRSGLIAAPDMIAEDSTP